MRALIGVVVPTTTFLLLVAVGMDLTAADFARLRQQRALVLTGLLAPLVLLPPLAVAIVRLFGATPDVAVGILIVAACPIGGISNLYSYLARASTALSVTLTGLSCLFAAITIPLVGKAIEIATGRPLGIEAPLSLLAAQAFLVLGLPVGLGMWARHRYPTSVRHGPLLQRLAFGGVAVIIVLIIGSNVDAFVKELPITVPMVTVFVIASFVVGWVLSLVVTPERKDRFTLAAEFGTRNVGIATAIAVTILGRVEFARFTAMYALTEIPLLLAMVAVYRAFDTRR